MTVAEAKDVDASINPISAGTVVIIWRDCDLTFTDGTLVAIRPHAAIATQDGLTIGDDVSKAVQLYGSSAVQTDGGRTHAVFSAEPGSEVGYDVTYTPDPSAGAGQLMGTITAITVCRCKPAASVAAQVDANAYLKTPGRWWFRTPDDGWNCSIGARAFCESRAYTGNPNAAYPPPTAADEAASDCGEIGLVGGMIVGTSTKATYGLCGHGDGSEFAYDVDKGTPGLGRILADGQILTAGDFRCVVTGVGVSCTSATTGVGFTVSQDFYRLHPRDGAAPDAGPLPTPPDPSTARADVIGPDGYENLKLGMTVDQAQQADPSLVMKASPSASCPEGSTTDAERVVFNPDGTLSYIAPRGQPHTPEGLQVGDTADKAISLYTPGNPLTVDWNYGSNQYPVSPGSQVRYLIELAGASNDDSDARNATISGIVLNGGQRCFG